MPAPLVVLKNYTEASNAVQSVLFSAKTLLCKRSFEKVEEEMQRFLEQVIDASRCG